METIKRIIKNVLGKTQAECKAKLAAAMEVAKGVDVSRADEYTVATWLRSWYDIYAGPLRCGLHSPYLHPRYEAKAGRGRADHGQLYGAGHVSRSKRDERTEYPSAHLLPFPRISACGSRCGSKRFQRIKKRRQNIFLKGKSNLMIFDRYADLKYKYRPRNFGCRRYYVDTVGRNKNHSGVYPKPTGGGLCR